MTRTARIVYAPRCDATPDAEEGTLAAVYRFVLNCRAKNEAARTAAPNNAKESDEFRAKTIIPK